MKEQIERQLRIVESFVLQEYDVGVQYGGHLSNAYFHDIKIIEINSKQNYISRLHTLLHEVGHVLLQCHDEGHEPFRKQFPYMKKDNREARGDKKHRVDVIREEVLAWEYGKKLADSLSLNLDETKWNRHRQEALISYMEWY